MKYRFSVLFLILLAGCLILQAGAVEVPKTNSYTYSNTTGQTVAVYGPMPFLTSDVIEFDGMGGQIQNPVDLYVYDQNVIYIVDSEGNSIVELNSDFSIKRVFTGFDNGGQPDTFNQPQSICFDDDGLMYICDTGNERVVVVDQDLKLKKIYTCPKSDILGNDYKFQPLKITVDQSGNLYVINKNEYQGLLQIDSKGNFVNFIGSNKVVFSPIDAFWKSIMSSVQREQLLQFIPIEYTNISMDSDHFIYAVTASKDESSPIKRLNLSGTDVLNRSGYVDVTGDIDPTETVQSAFVDIVSGEDGVYYALDSSMGRIFVYNQDGYLLYAFAGMGNKAGLFKAPVAIEISGNRLYVLDQTNKSLTVFERTKYAELVERADSAFRHGRYAESEEKWNQVLEFNSNYELAYAQLGSVYLARGSYREAMTYFKLGNYRGNKLTLLDGYNKAFNEYRKGFAREYLGGIAAVVILFVIALILVKAFLKKKRSKSKTGRNNV